MSLGPVGPRGGQRRPSLKGSLQIDIVRGVERVRAWPRPRGKSTAQITKEQNEKFRIAQLSTKYWDPTIYNQITEAVKGTPLLPRDIMTMIMYGRLMNITIAGERAMSSEQAIKDISESLDILGAIPGGFLYRGPELWECRPLSELGGIAGIRSACIYRNTPQGTAPGAYSKILFDTQKFGIAGLVDLPNSRLVVPEGANRANLTLDLGASAVDTSGYVHCWIGRNGNTVGFAEAQTHHAENFFLGLNCTTGPIQVVPGDWFIAGWRSNPGASISREAGIATKAKLSMSVWAE